VSQRQERIDLTADIRVNGPEVLRVAIDQVAGEIDLISKAEMQHQVGLPLPRFAVACEILPLESEPWQAVPN
jgi:hypothetical protein